MHFPGDYMYLTTAPPLSEWDVRANSAGGGLRTNNLSKEDNSENGKAPAVLKMKHNIGATSKPKTQSRQGVRLLIFLDRARIP